ncbi:MAG: LacI family DNA-binding transcriptional regulator [Pseudomonadota bacterium]
MRSVTISDVAALAKVSTATVSRALATPGRVSAEARERVLAAVRQTGYTPNVAARSLRVARSMMVLVVVPWQITPFFSDLLLFIDRALAAHGYGMLVGDLHDRAEQEPRLVQLAAAGQVDGLILLNGDVLSDGERRVDEMGVPIVGLCVPAGPKIAAVLVDDFGGGAAVARHFLELGHKRFGYVAGPADNHNEVERFRGFRQTLVTAGIPGSSLDVFAGDFHIASGAAAGRQFLMSKKRPTAIFCASDIMAMGFMHCIQASGVRVPADVSVAGFDGLEIAQYSSPSLTTVVQPCAHMGKAAANHLLDILGTATTDCAQSASTMVLEVCLREGGSTAPPPSG